MNRMNELNDLRRRDRHVVLNYLARWRPQYVADTTAVAQTLVHCRHDAHDERVAGSLFGPVLLVRVAGVENGLGSCGAADAICRARRRQRHLWTAGLVRFDLHQEIVLEEDEADDGEHVDENEGQDGRQDDGTTVARHRTDHVEQRLLAVDDVKQLQTAKSAPGVGQICHGTYQNGKEEGVRHDAHQAKDQVGHVIEDLRVGDYLAHIPRESTRIAHDAQQVDRLQHHLKGKK